MIGLYLIMVTQIQSPDKNPGNWEEGVSRKEAGFCVKVSGLSGLGRM